MRWFCVHPALPDNATLRVRSYASGDAPELGRRVPKGRAVAVTAPPFEVAVTETDGAGVAETHRWARVAVPDPATGEERDGFMMASLPDGTDLLTPWHKAGFRCCCRAEDPRAFLFNGPAATADVVGPLESVDLPYGVLEVEGDRALVLHEELGHVWINTKALDPVCLPLRHAGCSVMHAFYMLSEALPTEAQIAIRTFPSMEADSVGLLSHGDILEVAFRSGQWLQIATADGGDAFWIMWTTDTVELLAEVHGHASPRCKSIAQDGAAEDQAGLSEAKDDVVEIQDQVVGDEGDPGGDLAAAVGDADRNGVNSADAIPDASDESVTDVSDTAAPDSEPTAGSTIAEASESTDVETQTGRDHDQASPDGAMDGESTRPVQVESSWEDRPIKPARQQQFSWDDRPIRSNREDNNPSVGNPDEAPSAMAQISSDSPMDSPVGEATTSLQEPVPCMDAAPIAAPADSDIAMAEEDASDITVASVEGEMAGTVHLDVTVSPDERPIRPAAHAHAWDDMPIRPAVEDEQDEGVSSDGLPAVNAEAVVDQDDRPIRPGVVDSDIGMQAMGGEADDIDPDTEDVSLQVEQQHPGFDLDDRPIRPAQLNELELAVQPADSGHDRDIDEANELLADCNGDGGNSNEVEMDMQPDDRPIRPASQQQPWSEQPLQPDQVNVINSTAHAAVLGQVEPPAGPVPVEDTGDMDIAEVQMTDLEPCYDARVGPDPDERPIKPAQPQHPCLWDETSASANGASEGNGAEDHTRIAVAQPDERPIRPAKASAWDEQPIQPSTADSMVESTEPGEDQSAGDASPSAIVEAQTSRPWDDRPIKPAPQSFAWDERPIRSAASNETMDMSGTQTQGDDVDGPVQSEPVQDGRQDAPGQADAVADMVIDGGDEEMETVEGNAEAGQAEDDNHSDERPIRPAQTPSAWDDRPIKPAGRSHGWDEQLSQSASEGFDMEAGDASETGQDQRDDTRASKTTDGDAELKSEGVRSGLTHLHLNTAPEPQLHRSPGSEPSPELEVDGYSLLTQHGIAAYYTWKKRLMSSSDGLSQIQYAALVDGDVDVLLETLAADVGLVDDWLKFVPGDRGAGLHSDPSRVVGVLYNRTSTPPKLPSPDANGHAVKAPVVPPSPTTSRNARLKSLFRRPPRGSDTSSVFEVIMGGGSADSILEAEVADDESDFALTNQFQYPSKALRGRGGTPGRPQSRLERNPMPIVGAGPGLRRATSAGSVAPSASNDSDVVLPGGNDIGERHPVLLTPAGKMNPLKRPAASIATTPPASLAAPQLIAEASSSPPTRQDQREEAAVPPPAPAPAPAYTAAPRSSIAPPAPATSSRVGTAPGSSLPASSLAQPRPSPLTSRLSAPSSISSLPQRTGSLPQPSAVSRSALPARSMSTTAATGVPGPSSSQTLLPRRSMLPTPTKPSALQAPAARAIAQATDGSSLEARRSTFGFGRPRPTTIPKPAK